MNAPGTAPQSPDFRLMIGDEPFDPIEVPVSVQGLATAKKATIVQFTALLTEPDVARVKAAYGLVLARFIPNLAFLERLDDGTVGRLRADFLVRSCTALDPALKLAPWIPATGTPLRLITTMFDDADAGTVRSALDAAGARDVRMIDDRPAGSHLFAEFTLDDRAALPLIAAIDDVVWAEPEPDAVDFNVEAAQTIQSGGVGVHGGTIWDQGLHGEGQVIGIIEKDGTIDLNHCFFADEPNVPGPGHRKILSLTRKNDTKVNEHAMFVAGIAAGDDRANPGTHPHRGGAFAARLVVRTRDNHLLKMLEDAKAAGATIHNNSWGLADITSYDKTARDADEFSFRNEDHVVVGAGAGFHEADNTPPGIAKNVLCVAAAKAFPLEMSDGDGLPGPTSPDKRRKPEIMAVGGGISSALVNPASPSAPYCLTGEPQVFAAVATSWAAPNAAAAAALVRQYFTEGWYPTGRKRPDRRLLPTGALIRAVLLNSTVDMTGRPGYPSLTEGWGLIRLDRTLFFDGARRRVDVHDVRHSAGLEIGQRRTHEVVVSSITEQLKITLVWTDVPPAETLHTLPARNLLRLEAEDPGGIAYVGNDIDIPTGLSRPVGSGPPGPPDLRNNVHMVIVDHPPVGKWKITVEGSVVFGQQGYALVTSGALK
ncbi:S8 family serine peptidase [Streptomyces sp. NPDC058464]|uniref:S8 family serine peptidase n=1 Tax=Streptomyces sp. NPDC058464 TaxID=3346511 RepID=UPI00365613A5